MWKKQQTSSGLVRLDVLLGVVLVVAADVNDLLLRLDRLGLHLGGLLGGLLLGLCLHLGFDLLLGLLRPDSLEGTLNPLERGVAHELREHPVVSGRLTPDDAVVLDLDHNTATPSILSLKLASNEWDVLIGTR